MLKYCMPLIALAVVACSSEKEPTDTAATVEQKPMTETIIAEEALTEVQPELSALDTVLMSQSPEAMARYEFRHPKETLEFFGVKPGDTVIEVLPGGGWYTKILLPFLGSDGELIGAFYPREIWAMFGRFDEEAIAKRSKQAAEWPEKAGAWQIEGGATISPAFEFGSMPEESHGQADSVLFIRALHNLNRFNEGSFRELAVKDAFDSLKSGGIVGVVQHRAPETHSDEWAMGSAGYLKQSAVISWFEEAGFTLVEASEINANPKDQPSEEDVVWRLPPTLAGSDDPEQKAAMAAIGESDRMTLKFVKP